MDAAIANGVDGIEAECGGSMTCATCHVYVDESWAVRLRERSDDEDEMLDETASLRQSTSRLSCQIVMHEDLDGLVVRLPPTQT